MNAREKIEAAFSTRGTPEIPAVICYEGIYIRDHWNALTGLPWWWMHAPDVPRQTQWQALAMERIGQDWFYLPWALTNENQTLQERPEGMFLVDCSNGREKRLHPPKVAGWAKDDPPASIHPESLADSEQAIDLAIPARDLSQGPAAWTTGHDELAQAMLEGPGRDLFPLSHVSSPLWSCYSLWGFEGMMTMVAERPELVEYACQRYLSLRLQELELCASLGVRGMWIEECLTDMISPRHFARFNVPCLRALVAKMREVNLRSIYYYCGNPHDRWSLLLECGTDALALEESKKGWKVDIEDVVRRVGGRCVVLGNLDAMELLEHGSLTQLRAEIKRQIAAGRDNGGRFIMSLGSPVTPGTSVERVKEYCDLVHELGGAG